MNIFLDSNIFYNNWFLDNPNIVYLIHYIKNTESKLLISDVVIKEVENKYREELSKQVSIIKNSTNSLRKLIKKDISFEKESLTYDYKIIDIIKSLSLTYEIVSSDSIPQTVVVDRAINKTKPFQDNEKGYRDTLIWLSLLDYAAKDKTNTEIAFICENKSDFYDTRNMSRVLFHPDLIADLNRVNKLDGIKPYSSLSSFTKDQINTTEHAIEHERIESKISEDIEIESEFYIEQLPERKLRNILNKLNIKLPSDSVILEVEAETIEGVEDPSIESLESLDDRFLFINYSYELRIVLLKIIIEVDDTGASYDLSNNSSLALTKDDNSISIETVIRPRFNMSFIFDTSNNIIDSFEINSFDVK